MTNDKLSRKRLKPSSEIRGVLKSIQHANEKRRARRDISHMAVLNWLLLLGLRNSNGVQRSVDYHRALLLRHAGLAGGFTGLMLGLNFGLAFSVAIGTGWLLWLMSMATALSGCVIGALCARIVIFDRRRDLFDRSLAG